MRRFIPQRDMDVQKNPFIRIVLRNLRRKSAMNKPRVTSCHIIYYDVVYKFSNRKNVHNVLSMAKTDQSARDIFRVSDKAPLMARTHD